MRVEFHRSASKHFVVTNDVPHAVANAFVVADMGNDESPLRTLVLEPDRSARGHTPGACVSRRTH